MEVKIMVKPNIQGETKNQKFRRIASSRTKRVLDDLRLLGNCANKLSYEYSEDDIEKIFSAIDKQMKTTKQKFSDDKTIEFEL